MTRRRWARFRQNRRGFYSLLLFLLLFGLSLGAEFLSNDKPLMVRYEQAFYFPLWRAYPETVFGGDFDTVVPAASLKAFEKSLQSQGKKVESLYGPWQHSYEYYAMTKRAAEFFVKYAGTTATE